MPGPRSSPRSDDTPVTEPRDRAPDDDLDADEVAAAAAATAAERRSSAARRRTPGKQASRAPTPSEVAVHVRENVSRTFVIAAVALYIVILLNGIFLGTGGVFRPLPTPAPTPSEGPSASPASSASPSTSASVSPTTSASTSP